MPSPAASLEDKSSGGPDTEAKGALEYNHEASISELLYVK